jgi:hypothetical protein
MDELIVDKKRDDMPRKGHIGGTSLKVREADDPLDTVDRNALLPKVVWPDVQPGLGSRLMDQLILLTGRRKWWASAAVVQERARRLALRPAPHRPVRLRHNVKVDLRFAEGWPIYHVEPAGSGSARHHVIFLHGGAYVHEIVGSHWRFIGYLVQETNTHCVVPIYPLAPRGTAKEVVPATGRILRELIDTVGAQNVTVIGNSAGGGLSLAAAQWLRESGHPQPNALILIFLCRFLSSLSQSEEGTERISQGAQTQWTGGSCRSHSAIARSRRVEFHCPTPAHGRHAYVRQARLDKPVRLLQISIDRLAARRFVGLCRFGARSLAR